MFTMRKITVLLFTLLIAATTVMCATDVTGKWAGSLRTSDGQSFPWYLNLKQDGDKLSGKMGPEREDDQRAISDGKIEGSTLRFRAPGGDGSGTEFLIVELHLQNEELTGTVQGKDRKGQMQTYALSLKRATVQ
jgi:hypothetical protein